MNRPAVPHVYLAVGEREESAVREVHTGPAVGLAGQVGLLAALAGTVGLTPSGWLAGLACGVVTDALLARALVRSGAARLGPANAVTLTRAALAGGVAALVASGHGHPHSVAPVVALATVGLVLDAVDGRVARRTGTVTRLGARFDGEVDALLLLALSVLAARVLAPWVLLIGGMRYAFLCAGVLPWLREPLPPRYWRKVVAAVQGVVLTVAVAGVLPAAWAETALGLALALLVESFGRDVWWLWRRHRSARAAAPVARHRSVVRGTAGAAATVLLWAALVAPDRAGDVRLSTFLRIPLEALVVVAAAAVLPARGRGPLAVLAGLVLSALTAVRALDVGFVAVLDRPFDVVGDWSLLGPALGVLRDSVGAPVALLVVVLAVGAGVAGLVALTTATLHVTHLAARHRTGSLRAVGALGAVWALCATLAVTTGSGVPVASTSAADLLGAQVHLVRTGLHDQRTFSRELFTADRYAARPGGDLLTGLRGRDVLLVFVESYGRVAVEGSDLSRPVDALLDRSTATLRAAGLSSRSAFLTSPTFGGGSWLAHATLQSGLWIDDQQRYAALEHRGRLTLSGAFRRAGWRTVVDIPSSPSPWPQGQRLYHFDRMYGTADVGYTGPAFSYAQVPDQYTLAALYDRELAAQPRRPVMAEVDLVSSHSPWAPLPRMVAWPDLGHGEVFAPMPRQGRSPAEVWRTPGQVAAAYGASIRYSLTALVSFLQTHAAEGRVVVLLGDHQPAKAVTGDGASHDVPVTLVGDRAVLDRTASWGWQDGMRPGPAAPVWRMDAFRDRFLSAYGPTTSAAALGRAAP